MAAMLFKQGELMQPLLLLLLLHVWTFMF